MTQPTPQAIDNISQYKRIERDADMDITYIPIHPKWEIQTKGNSSSFRIAKTGGSNEQRWLIWDEYLHNMLEEMATDLNKAWQSQVEPQSVVFNVPDGCNTTEPQK